MTGKLSRGMESGAVQVPALPLPVPRPPDPPREHAPFNFSAAAEDEEHVFGSERPGFIKPSRDAASTPRGPQVGSEVVQGWIDHVKAAGVKRVLCLLTRPELGFFAMDLLAVYREHFTAVVHVDPLSQGAYTAAAVLRPLLDAQSAGEAIVVQCATGQARTGAVLALWLHHRHLLPLPQAVERVTHHAAKCGAIRRPTLEGLMELLMTEPSAPRPPRAPPLPTRRPPRGREVQLTVVATGGTIDKDYPRTVNGYAFEIGPPAAGRVLEKLHSGLSYELVSVCRKDSQDMRDQDRDALANVVRSSSSSLVVVTHGTDTMLETAMFLKEAGLGPDKVVVLTGAHKPQKFTDTDADFNLGQAVASVQVLQPGVYVCMSGRVIDASIAKRDARGVFCSR